MLHTQSSHVDDLFAFNLFNYHSDFSPLLFFFGVRRFSSLYFTQTFVLVCVFIPRIALLSTSNALQNDPRVAREHNDDFVSVATRCQSVPLFSHR